MEYVVESTIEGFKLSTETIKTPYKESAECVSSLQHNTHDFNHMSTNDTIITIARRVSEKSPLDNWLLMVRYSKSEDVLKIMMATDKDIHLKSIIKINMYTFSLKQRYIEINKMNTVYTANISTNCSLSTWFTVKRRTTYSITSNANPMKHRIRKSLCTFLTKHPKISIRISMCTKISQQQTHIVKGWAQLLYWNIFI